MAASPLARDGGITARQRWDIDNLIATLLDSDDGVGSLEAMYSNVGQILPQQLVDLLNDIDEANVQDDDDRRALDENGRAPFQSLASFILRAQALETSLMSPGPLAPGTYRQFWDDYLATQPAPVPLSFPTRWEAEKRAEEPAEGEQEILRPYRVVDLDDEADMDSKAAELLGEVRHPDDDDDGDVTPRGPGTSGGGSGFRPGPGPTPRRGGGEPPATPWRPPPPTTFELTSPYVPPTVPRYPRTPGAGTNQAEFDFTFRFQ